MSKTMVMLPIVAALAKSEDILGKNRIWKAVNNSQKEFLNKFFSKRDEIANFSEDELKSWVSLVASELNEILVKEGFDIKLEDFKEGEFGVVSILDVLVEWLKEGMKTRILFDNKEYPAVRLNRYAEIDSASTELASVYTPNFLDYTLNDYLHPIASVATKSGDKVWMTVADKRLGGFKLISRIEKLRTSISKNPVKTHFDRLIFPMVDLNQKVDISWLTGMLTSFETGCKYKISQALQQTKFKMNQFGAHVKSAVAIAIRATSARLTTELMIDKPFYLWIERNGVSYPILYAYIDADDWKNPGDLKNI